MRFQINGGSISVYEIKEGFSIGSHKDPSLDGVPSLFYQKYWVTIDHSCTQFIHSIYSECVRIVSHQIYYSSDILLFTMSL